MTNNPEGQTMKRLHRTKIVATLGPATSTPDKIAALFEAGVDVFRLNFSHGAHADHRTNIASIRALEAKTNRPAAILMDLQGPKLRIGVFAGDQTILKNGAAFRFVLKEIEGDATQVTLPHKEIYAGIEPGTDLLLDDGRLRVRVQECGPDFAQCEVITGGVLSNRKGVNVPGVILPISPLTPKDRKDLQFGLDMGVDFIGLSFVQRPEDIAEARRLIAGRAAVLAKLEKPAAIDHLEEIIELSDAVMVARGDLGVEMPPEDVPVLQKRIIQSCRQVGKPVVVATQMLESMIDSPTPTRAEASDVATAVYDGADAVMLSAETAVGDYPTEAAAMMNRIIERVECAPNYRRVLSAEELEP
jgi:pyruvate kinase